jgi:PIN domain nuclease of toxin-antitoxin system
MKYLLDTHILIWFISGDKKLSLYAKELIENEDNELLVSIASLWEMAIKFNLGKLELGQPFEDLFPIFKLMVKPIAFTSNIKNKG